jgi:hypothetical protein
MHRGADTRGSHHFDLQTITVLIANNTESGDHLALAVLDLVRICVHQCFGFFTTLESAV